LLENDKLNLLFCAEIYYRQNGLRNVEPFSDAERDGFAILITDHHKNDEDLQKVMPLNPHSKDLFVATANSVLLRFLFSYKSLAKSILFSKMIQRADPEAIDMSQINTSDPLESEQIAVNSP